MTEEVEKKLIEFITKNYNPKHGGKTEEWSFGNSTDVFSDGQEQGTASTLYDIAKIIGLEVEELAEQKFDY